MPLGHVRGRLEEVVGVVGVAIAGGLEDLADRPVGRYEESLDFAESHVVDAAEHGFLAILAEPQVEKTAGDAEIARDVVWGDAAAGVRPDEGGRATHELSRGREAVRRLALDDLQAVAEGDRLEGCGGTTGEHFAHFGDGAFSRGHGVEPDG